MRGVLPCLLGLAAALPTGCGVEAGARVATPAEHVVLIVVDTLRADRLDAFGGSNDTTVAIDEIARRGVRFTRATAQSSWTAPSMVSLLTSRYLAGRRLIVPADLTTLAEHFQRAGFETAAFVTNELIGPQNGFDRGFDQFHLGRQVHADGAVADWVASRAGQRTFTYVHLSEPHDPYRPPATHVRKRLPVIDEAEREMWAAASAEYELDDLEGAIERIAAQRVLYEGEVRATDEEVYRILRALSETGQLERTAIAFTADHGEGLWSHLDRNTPAVRRRGDPELERTVHTAFKKRHGAQLYEELIRVPLILMAPDLPAGAAREELVENVDVAPTLLELAGIPPPPGLDGWSLVGLARGEGGWAKREAFSMTRYARSLTTAEGFKLIEPTDFGRFPADVRRELFDLVADPGERVDLAAERPELVAELAARIAAIEARGLGSPGAGAAAELKANEAALRALGYVEGADLVVDPPVAAEATRDE